MPSRSLAEPRLAAAVAALEAARELIEASSGESIPDKSPAPPLLLDFPSAGERAGLSRTRIFELVKAGELPAVEVPGGGRMIRLADLEAFVAGLAEAK